MIFVFIFLKLIYFLFSKGSVDERFEGDSGVDDAKRMFSDNESGDEYNEEGSDEEEDRH